MDVAFFVLFCFDIYIITLARTILRLRNETSERSGSKSQQHAESETNCQHQHEELVAYHSIESFVAVPRKCLHNAPEAPYYNTHHHHNTNKMTATFNLSTTNNSSQLQQ